MYLLLLLLQGSLFSERMKKKVWFGNERAGLRISRGRGSREKLGGSESGTSSKVTVTCWACVVPVPSEADAWDELSVLVRKTGHLSLACLAISPVPLLLWVKQTNKQNNNRRIKGKKLSMPFFFFSGIGISEFFLWEWEKNWFWKLHSQSAEAFSLKMKWISVLNVERNSSDFRRFLSPGNEPSTTKMWSQRQLEKLGPFLLKARITGILDALKCTQHISEYTKISFRCELYTAKHCN